MDYEKLERVRLVVRGLEKQADTVTKCEAYDAIAAILNEGDPSDALVSKGVTAERVAELRAIVESPRTSVVSREALRDALQFYDLVRKAWLGARDEYNELYDRLNIAIADAATLISEGFDEEARREWLGRLEVKDARKARAEIEPG